MMIDVGDKLVHSTIGNLDMIATKVELLEANWRAYQSLGHSVQAFLSFWEFCELRGMHKPMEIQWNFDGMMRRIKEEDERVVQGAMVGNETVEHTPVDEMPSVVEVSIDEVPRVVNEFSSDSNAQQVDEVSRDISTVDEDPTSTEASKSMTVLSDYSHLQLTGEHVLHVGLSTEEQLEAHVEPMMEEDVQPSFGLAIDEGQLRDHTLGSQHNSLQRHIDRIYSVISVV